MFRRVFRIRFGDDWFVSSELVDECGLRSEFAFWTFSETMFPPGLWNRWCWIGITLRLSREDRKSLPGVREMTVSQLYVPHVPGMMKEYEFSPNQAHLRYRVRHHQNHLTEI